jgi:hypothetical protein
MRSAIGTDSDILDPASQHLVSVGMNELSVLKSRWNVAKVIEPPAFQTTDMVVVLSFGVEASFRPAHLDLCDHIIFNENLKIPIHRSEADSGQALADDRIQLSGCRVAGQPLQLLVNYLPLLRIPLSFYVIHHRLNQPLSIIITNSDNIARRQLFRNSEKTMDFSKIAPAYP